VLVAEHKEPRRFGVVVPGPGNKVQAIEEKPENPKTNLVVTGVYVFDDRIFKYKLVRNERLGEYFHPELVSQLLKDHEMVIEETDFWHPIGFPHDIDAAEELLRKNERSAARQTSNIPVVILAGGKGTRMPDHEKDKPKCLVDVAGKPMLAWQIEELHKQGFFNIHLALGHKADMVVEWLKKAGHKDVSYAIEHEPLGTGGAMKLALAGANGPFVGINCDDFADVNLYSLIRHSCENTYCVLSAAEIGDARTFGLIECDDKKKICAFKEKDPNIQKGLVNIGHYYLHSDIFDGMPKAFSIEKDVFLRLAVSGKLVLHSHNGYWVTANNAEQLASTRDYFEKLYS
jgi:NDP-sugar pyrophosphorylase family protein